MHTRAWNDTPTKKTRERHERNKELCIHDMSIVWSCSRGRQALILLQCRHSPDIETKLSCQLLFRITLAFRRLLDAVTMIVLRPPETINHGYLIHMSGWLVGWLALYQIEIIGRGGLEVIGTSPHMPSHARRAATLQQVPSFNRSVARTDYFSRASKVLPVGTDDTSIIHSHSQALRIHWSYSHLKFTREFRGPHDGDT